MGRPSLTYLASPQKDTYSVAMSADMFERKEAVMPSESLEPQLRRPDFSRCRKLILVRTDRLGDMLVTTPCIRALRQALPGVRLDMLASAHNAPAIRGNPYLDAVHIFDRKRPLTWPGLVRRLRAERYDAALVFNSNSRSASFLSMLLETPERIGFSGAPMRNGRVQWGYGGAYTLLPQGAGSPQVTLDMLEKLDAIGIPSYSPHMDFLVPEELTQAMRQRFPAEPGRLRLAMFVGNIKKVTKRWPLEKFRELSLRLLETEQDVEITILTGPSDRPLLQGFADVTHPRLTFFTGNTLQESGAFLQTCCAMVAGSSGPTHVAAALDVPVLSVTTRYSATVWGTLGPYDDCVTPDSDTPDMRGIAMEPVEAMVRKFLTEERERRQRI